MQQKVEITLTRHIEDGVSELVPRLEVAVLVDELCEGQVHVKLVRVRVLSCTLQRLDGLCADLVVLLHSERIH